MRSRIKGARAEGRLQLTNKRILFRAKGTAPVGETTIQHEFSIDEVAGFQIVRNFRFSILDLLLIFALSVAIGYIGVGFGGFLGRTLKAFGQLLVYVLALAVAVPAFVWMPREQYAGKCVFLSASVGLFTVLREMIYFKSSFLTVLSQIFIYVPYLIFGVRLCLCVCVQTEHGVSCPHQNRRGRYSHPLRKDWFCCAWQCHRCAVYGI